MEKSPKTDQWAEKSPEPCTVTWTSLGTAWNKKDSFKLLDGFTVSSQLSAARRRSVPGRLSACSCLLSAQLETSPLCCCTSLTDSAEDPVSNKNSSVIFNQHLDVAAKFNVSNGEETLPWSWSKLRQWRRCARTNDTSLAILPEAWLHAVKTRQHESFERFV